MIVILLPLIILLGSLVNLYYRELGAQAAENDLQTAIKNLAEIESIHALLAESATGVRGYLLTGRDDFLTRYYVASDVLPATISKLKTSLGDKQQQQLVSEMQPLVTKKLFDLKTLVATGSFMPKNELTSFLVSQKKLLDAIRVQIDSLKTREVLLINQKQLYLQKVRTRNLDVTVLTAILVVFSTFAAAWFYNAAIVKRVYALRDNADKLVKGQVILNVDNQNDELGELAQRLQESSKLIFAKQNEIEAAHNEAVDASQAKTIFLSRTSHELRTPLNAILGFAQLLESELTVIQQKNSAKQIVVAGQHLLKLINDVLDIARIESGNTLINIQHIALKPVIKEAVAYVEHLAGDRNIKVNDCSAVDLYVQADRKKLLQILLNIISNALKYGPSDAEVTIWHTEKLGIVTIFIKDQGAGIAPVMRHRIFTPFDRLGAEKTNIEGTGLGLSLSKNLIESMGGEIGLLPNDSTFWFSCKIANTIHDDAFLVEQNHHVSGAFINNKNILYVEDNLSNIALIEALLLKFEYITLKCVGTCKEARDYLQKSNIDLLLLDLQLPDASGTTIIEYIATLPQHHHVPIFVLTADATTQTESQLKALNITHFFTKPFNLKQLTNALMQYLTRKAMQ